MERDWSWNKYRSEIVTQPKTNNLDYMIDPTLRNINRLFVLLWKMVTMVLQEFWQELMPLVEIKYYNVLIHNNPFFYQPLLKNKQEVYGKLVKMSRKNDYTKWNLLDYSYHQNYCKPIGIDLSRQTNMTIPQGLNFTWWR